MSDSPEGGVAGGGVAVLAGVEGVEGALPLELSEAATGEAATAGDAGGTCCSSCNTSAVSSALRSR